jgi:hypothetical protein
MALSNYAIITGGTITNVVAWDGASPLPAALASALGPQIDQLSPVPQMGWAAAEAGGVWSFTAPAAPAPTLAEQAATALTAGITITSTSNPALNGTYACDPNAQARIQAISLYGVVNSAFPGGGSTYPWLDTSGTPHTFPNVAAFQGFATAVANYVAALDFVLAGVSSTLPSSSVTIA